MFAELQNSFAAMNLAIDDSVARARNAPPPAPSDPDSRKFWRVHCDWSPDTDLDGSPDWAEFEMAANGNGGMVAGVQGNAFNADSNSDGIPDGGQLDADGDGTADAFDIASSDATATYEIGQLPRYAVFPISNEGASPPTSAPLQMSDLGTVLYHDRTWTAGAWTPLAPAGGSFSFAEARAINDQNRIIGFGNAEVQTGTETSVTTAICDWSSPAAQPAVVSTGGGTPTFASPTGGGLAGYLHIYNGLFSGCVLSNENTFFMDASQWDAQSETFQNLGYSEWTLPETSGQAASRTAAGDGLVYNRSADLRWGALDGVAFSRGIVHAPNALPELPFVPINVAIAPNDRIIAMSRNNNQDGKVRHGETWHADTIFAKAIDISDDGTAIGKSHKDLTAPILLNGKWTDIKRYAPDVSEWWRDSTVGLLDTTPSGWVLATRGDDVLNDWEDAVMLPLRVHGHFTDSKNEVVERAVGVDDFSIGSSNPAASSDNIDHVQDRIWIMTPLGGPAKTVVFKVPVQDTDPVKLTADGILFGGQAEGVCNTEETTLSVCAGTGADSGDEKLVTIKMGTAESNSKPIGLKVMKRRTVKVAVWRVSSDKNPPDMDPGAEGYKEPKAPDFNPTEEDLNNYLNDVFAPQINAVFDCKIHEITVRFDIATGLDFNAPVDKLKAGNGFLDTNFGLGKEFIHIRNKGFDDTRSINLYIVGGVLFIRPMFWDTDKGEFYLRIANGMPLVDDRLSVIADGYQMEPEEILDTLAHEIGHIIIGAGHPDQNHSEAVLLPGTRDVERLMCSGPKRRKDGFSRLLVKQEWDKAEVWLNQFVSP